MRYELRVIKEDVPMKDQKKSENKLKDLLTIMPVLHQHKMEAEVRTTIKKLRDGRKKKHYTLELSRKFATYDAEKGKVIKEIKVSAPITKNSKKVQVLKELKSKIIAQIQEARKLQRTPIEDYVFSEGVKVKKLAEVYLEDGTFLKVANKRVRMYMTTKSKFPKDNEKYVGIEIELAMKESRDELCDLLFEAGLGKHIHVKGDGSIGAGTNLLKDYPNACEITVLAKESEVYEVVNKICTILNEKIDCDVDKTCGLHIHLDMRNRDVAKSFANLIIMQPYLYAMVPANRKNNKYSAPVKDKTWKVSDNHYDGVSSNSYTKYKTIETRMHCGTTQASKINGWIKFLRAIADAPALKNSPKNMDEVAHALNLDSDNKTYVESRIAKFADQHIKVKATASFLDSVESVVAMPDTTIEETSEVA